LITIVKQSIVYVLLLLLLTSCRPAGFIYTDDGRIESGADGKPIILTNNSTAEDPTFDELMTFIKVDATDSREYIEGAFVCADFAEMVHNNAEAAGIRAAWVGLTFNGTEEGHALNAFETTDKGLIFIDCTNSGITNGQSNGSRNCDAIAYIEEGKKYGVLLVERMMAVEYDFYSLEYTFYAECEKSWYEYQVKSKAYNEEVTRFNQEMVGHTYVYGSPEANRMLAWKETLQATEKELERLKAQAGGRWIESAFSSYLVKSYSIHW
jgi:hypothetical protein